MSKRYYIASCLFTARFPQTSQKIQDYIRERHSDVEIVRCCLPNYRIKENTERIPDEAVRRTWSELPPSAELAAGDVAYSLCHNCTNIIDEQHPGVQPVSLWELIDRDGAFPYPDYGELKATVQDCWRSRDRVDEQAAVRRLLARMNIAFVEAAEHHGATEFCGSTLYREQPAKNARFAPRHYVEQAQGKFRPHTPEEQVAIMRDYCSRFTTETVICYCHYCLEGLQQGGVDARHIAHLLFP